MFSPIREAVDRQLTPQKNPKENKIINIDKKKTQIRARTIDGFFQLEDGFFGQM